MKKGIHPEYREVAFVDLSINQTFIIRSAAQTRETIEIDGVTYPMYKLDTSSASHRSTRALRRASSKPAALKSSAPSSPPSSRP